MSIQTIDERVRKNGFEKMKRHVRKAFAAAHDTFMSEYGFSDVASEQFSEGVTLQQALIAIEQKVVDLRRKNAEELAVAEFVENMSLREQVQ